MNHSGRRNTIVIWKLDRSGPPSSTKGFSLELVEIFQKSDQPYLLNDPIDTISPGMLVFQIFCALAEHERHV